jgi:membrane-associated phospholipid phosphatase
MAASRPAARLALAGLLAASGNAAAAPREPGPPLVLDPARDAAIIAGAGALALGLSLESSRLTPSRCRLCSVGTLDDEPAEELRWRSTGRAATLSDLVANVALPAGAAAALLASAAAEGTPREGLRDLVPVVEAARVTIDHELVTKYASARARPSAPDPRAAHGNELHSFFSGHTSLAFAVVVSTAEVATLRRYPAAPWLWAIGLPLAAGVGYLRMAAGAHWLTDVLAGAAVGSAVGFGVPYVLHRPRHGPAVTLRLAPGRLAIDF